MWQSGSEAGAQGGGFLVFSKYSSNRHSHSYTCNYSDEPLLETLEELQRNFQRINSGHVRHTRPSPEKILQGNSLKSSVKLVSWYQTAILDDLMPLANAVAAQLHLEANHS